MLLYLLLAHRQWEAEGKMRNLEDLKEAIHYGAVKRVRPKVMMVLTTTAGLLPIMWASSYETGADVLKRIAAPMVGGLFTSLPPGAHHLSGHLPAVERLWPRRLEIPGGWWGLPALEPKRLNSTSMPNKDLNSP